MKKLMMLVLFLPALALAIDDMKWFDLNHWRAPFHNDGRWGFDTTVVPGVAGGSWPQPLHNCYVFGAGAWVGSIVGSDTLVTIGYNPNSGATEFGPTLNRHWRDGTADPDDRVYRYPGDWPPPLSRFPMAPQQPRSEMDMWCCFGDSNASNHSTDWQAFDVAVAGSHAYVAGAGAVPRIIDVSDPQTPYQIGLYDTSVIAYGVALAGNYAYVASLGSGLLIIDASNPQNPYRTGSYDTPGYAFGVAVVDSYAYVADSYAGLRIINVSDPHSPYEQGYFDTPGNALGVAVSGIYAYVADESAGLRIINVSNPQTPYEEGYCDTPGRALGVAVSGSNAYVADGDSGLRIVNVSNPQSPCEEGHCDTPGWANDVAVAGSNAYVADGNFGLRIIDVSAPQAPSEIGHDDTPGSVGGVAVVGSYAYVADGAGGLRVIDISDPQNPHEAGSCRRGGRPLGIDVYLTVCGFADSLAQDFFFLKYELANRASDSLRETYFGMMLDPDIGDAVDDMTGLILDRLFQVGPDTIRVRNAGFAYDYNNRENAGRDWESGTPGAVAVMLLSAPQPLGLTAFKKLTIDVDPVTDVTQYLTLAGYDYRTGIYSPYDSVDASPADKRVLLASGPFDVAPDSVLTFWYAVIGSPFGDSGQYPSGRDTSELALRCKRARDYFDRLIGVAEEPPTPRNGQPIATVVRSVLMIGSRGQKTGDRAQLLDISGRKVLDLKPGANDVRHLSPGVYFVREAHQAAGLKPQAARKIVIAR